MSLCPSSEVDCTFVRCQEEVEYEKYLSKLVQRFDRQPLPELGRSLVILRYPFNPSYFAQPFNYWERDRDSENHLRRHARGKFAGWNKDELLALLPSCRPSYLKPRVCAESWRVRFYVLVPTSTIFGYYSSYILKHHPCQDWVWPTPTSEFLEFPFVSFLRVACAGTCRQFLVIVAY